MPDFSDSIKHLRSIHLVFVLAAAAIVMALSSSDSIYKTAVEQVRDVVALVDAQTANRIADSIAETAGVAKDRNKLKDFIKASLAEFLEQKEVYFDSLELGSFHVDMGKEEEFGHIHNISAGEEYYYRSRDEKYWFGWRNCLLGDGTNLYAHPDDLALRRVTDRTTLNACASFLNRMLQINALYAAPTFSSRYFFEGPVADRYPGISVDIAERLGKMKDVRLSVTLTKAAMTDRQSRSVFKNSQEHAVEDPAGYTDYDFRFDTLTLKVVARPKANPGSGERVKSLSFTLELPVMFQVREPEFMAQALQKASFDKAYYSRYLSGARSFERLFPELAQTTQYLDSALLKDLELYLEEQARSSGGPISLLGLQISRELIRVWGVLLMLCAQLYFCMHYRALISRINRNSEGLFPWIGLYRDYVSTIAFQISIALPFCACLFILKQDWPSHFRLLEISWLFFALLLLGWTEVLYVRYRKMPARK